MNWWMKLRVLPHVWRGLPWLLANVEMNRLARTVIERNGLVLQDALDLIAAQRDEIRRLSDTGESDARLLVAYQRWCARQGCTPSQQDLNDVLK